MTRVLVGIVFHSGLDDLRRCMASLRDLDDARVVILDSSPDGAAKPLAEEFSVEWMDGSRNAGYAWGLHRITERWLDRTDVLIASNSDVQFMRGSALALIEHTLALDGVCYPLQTDLQGVPASYNVHAQLSIRTLLAQWLGLGRGRMRRRNDAVVKLAARTGRPVRLPEGLYGSGAALAMPSGVWQSTGGFDQRFFLFSEDKSFGTTLSRHAIPAYLCGDAPVVHIPGTLSRGVRAEPVIEAVVSEQLNWDRYMRAPVILLLVTQTVSLAGRVLWCALKRRQDARVAYARALRYRVRHLSIDSAAPRANDGFRVPAWRRDEPSQDAHRYVGGDKGRRPRQAKGNS